MAASGLRNNRDFRMLWIGGFLAILGGQIAMLAVPLMVLAETDSPAIAGFIGTVSLTVLLLTMIPGGAVADSYERHRLVVVCEGVAALGSAAMLVNVAAG